MITTVAEGLRPLGSLMMQHPETNHDHLFAIWTLFSDVPRWWLARGCPPTVEDARPWAKAVRISLLLGMLGCASAAVTALMSQSFEWMWISYRWRPPFRGTGVPLSLIVLFPLSRWSGGSWLLCASTVVLTCLLELLNGMFLPVLLVILALLLIPRRSDRWRDMLVRFVAVILIVYSGIGLGAALASATGYQIAAMRLPNAWRMTYQLARQSCSLALVHASVAIALGTRLWWERPAEVFDQAPKWWGRPECPPPLQDDRWWVRLPRMCILAGTLGVIASLAILGVLYWFRAAPGPLTDRYFLAGLLFGGIVLAPMSHWLGRPRWQAWLSVPVGGAAFAAPAALNLVPIGYVHGWHPGGEFMGLQHTIAIALVISLWMGIGLRRVDWPTVLVPLGSALLASSPHASSSYGMNPLALAEWCAIMAIIAGWRLGWCREPSCIAHDSETPDE